MLISSFGHIVEFADGVAEWGYWGCPLARQRGLTGVLWFETRKKIPEKRFIRRMSLQCTQVVGLLFHFLVGHLWLLEHLMLGGTME